MTLIDDSELTWTVIEACFWTIVRTVLEKITEFASQLCESTALDVNYHKILSLLGLGDCHSMKQHLVKERGYDSKTVGKTITVKNYVQTWEKLISDEN